MIIKEKEEWPERPTMSSKNLSLNKKILKKNEYN